MKIHKYKAWDKALSAITDVIFIDFAEKIAYLDTGDKRYPQRLNEIELMQSTGLRDINNKEIFEGDIVKAVSFARWIGVVKYSEEKAAFMLKDSDTSGYRDGYVFLSQFEDGFEVLGNIYENPDILENAE